MTTEQGPRKESIDTPALLVDLDRLQRNIDRMARTIIGEAGVGWRPHTKAMKTPQLARLCLDAGAHGITCAKLGEAEVMADAGILDILIANQIVGQTKIDRLVRLCGRADVIVCVDDVENVRQIDRAALAQGVRVRVLIEVDVGMARAGVPPGEETVALAREIAKFSNVHFTGLQTWESHALAASDELEKKQLVRKALSEVTDTADSIRNAGIPVEIVSCGGTGTYWLSAFAPGITEIEAGGGIYSDVRYHDQYGLDHEYALTLLATITSRPTANRLICDAGFKALSTAHGNPKPIGCGPIESFNLSAEHGVITLVEPSATPRTGETIEIIPGYSDSTVFLHDHLYGIRDGQVESTWPIVGRGKIQ